MQTSIFGKPLDQVKMQDIRDFCTLQHKEGINLDYKRDLTSKSLVKTISAFANTRGGFVIVGVDDEDDKPKLPVEGLAWRESLALTITSAIIDNMRPYLSVQVHVCEPEAGRTFIIIQVPESHEAPHWLFNRSELYVRRADRSDHTDWERLATENEWEFLRNKREKAIGLRSDALRGVKRIFELEELLDDRRHTGISTLAGIKRNPLMDLIRTTVVPTFPREALADVRALNGYFNSTSIQAILAHEVYPSAYSSTKAWQDGVYRYDANDQGLPQSFNALSRLGVVATYERVVRDDIEDLKFYTYFSHVLESIESTMRYAGIMYRKLGYEGSVLCCTDMSMPNNTTLLLADRFSMRTVPRNLTGEFSYHLEATTQELNDHEALIMLFHKIMTEFVHSFGYIDSPDSITDGYLATNGVYASIERT